MKFVLHTGKKVFTNFGVFTYLSITQSLFMGSEYFMLYEDLDKVGRHNDILVWNKIYGFT
jgi:hypothetical protein